MLEFSIIWLDSHFAQVLNKTQFGAAINNFNRLCCSRVSTIAFRQTLGICCGIDNLFMVFQVHQNLIAADFAGKELITIIKCGQVIQVEKVRAIGKF